MLSITVVGKSIMITCNKYFIFVYALTLNLKITWLFDKKIHVPLTLKNAISYHSRSYINSAYYLMDNYLPIQKFNQVKCKEHLICMVLW